MNEREFICSKCDGFGYNPNDKTEKICPLCKGSGIVVKKEKPIIIETPDIDPIEAWIIKQAQKRRVIK